MIQSSKIEHGELNLTNLVLCCQNSQYKNPIKHGQICLFSVKKIKNFNKFIKNVLTRHFFYIIINA